MNHKESKMKQPFCRNTAPKGSHRTFRAGNWLLMLPLLAILLLSSCVVAYPGYYPHHYHHYHHPHGYYGPPGHYRY